VGADAREEMGASPNLRPSPATPDQSPLTLLEQPEIAKKLQLLPDKRLLRTKTTVVAGFAAGILLSPKLWVSSRYYPLVPVVHGLPHIPYPLDYLCYGALLLLLFAIAFAARPRIYIWTFVAAIAVYSLWDQTRWQPWAYQYWLMLIALGCFSYKPDDLAGERDALNICRLILGCTYFYSGLQKMNHRFVDEGFPWVMNTLHIHFPGLGYLGWVAACIEVSIGLTLLTRKLRKLGILNGVIMHVFILFSFGPWGRNWNSVVWPWNIVMIALILVLFWKTDVSFADIVWRNRFVYQKAVLVLLGIMPSLSFFGFWPSDLSVALYTANLTEANVLVSERVKQQLPPSVQRYVQPIAGHLLLRVQDWSFGELNVPPYAEIQSFNTVGSTVCRFANNSPDILLTGQEKNTLLGKGKEIRNTCFGTLVVDPF
jgi:uncharacterized membrane protein YphA (DoxX/SURF4 family)